MLQTVSVEALPIMKEVSLERRPLKIGVFVANITNKFILGLDILRAYNASVGIGHQMLRLGEETVSLWSPQLAVANNQVRPAQCEAVLMARLDSPLRKKIAW
jgi:hypothetical protein